MNAYEKRQEAKRARLLEAAEKADAESNRRAKQSMDRLPWGGQPILIGHHSEARHRRDLERSDNDMRKAVEADRKAKDLRGRAASIGTGGISADDPEALTKLRAKLQKMEQGHAYMKAANKAVRALLKKGFTHESEDLQDAVAVFAKATGHETTEATVRTLLTPDFCNRIGFASYQLTNSNARIKATRARIAELEALETRETRSTGIDGLCTYVENAEARRVQFVFDGKPRSEIRAILKSHAFKWAPSQQAWQRQLNAAGQYAAKQVMRQLRDLTTAND